MAEENQNQQQNNENKVGSQPIVIKKIKKGGHGHHGGAWKVAYADFVTAMMAFFLLLWLLNVTTEEQKQGIADYFAPTIAASPSSGGAGIFGGESPFESDTKIDSAQPFGYVVDRPVGADGSGEGSEMTEQDAEQVVAQKEEEQFERAEEELRQAMEEVPEMADLSENLIIERTPEGLRIQIVDQEDKPMFPLGSAEMYDRTRKLIGLVAKVIQKLPNKIAIAGHTDATPYRPGAAVTNWELSADRANASRRELEKHNISTDRLYRVTGKAATDLLVPDEPQSARNRRISILLLREVPY